MFRKVTTAAREASHKQELRHIGQELLQLIQRNDADSQARAIQIIEAHTGDDEVINARRFYQTTPLILACKQGNKAIAEKLLAATCIDVNRPGRGKQHALDAALRARQYDIALLLAANKRVHVNATDASGIHPVYITMDECTDCPFIITKTLLSRPEVDLTKTYRVFIDNTSDYRKYFHNMLHSLIHKLYELKSNAVTARQLYNNTIAEREEQNYRDGLELLANMLAARKIDIDEYATERDFLDRTKSITPLMLAVKFHLPDVVALLIAAGANPDLQDEQMFTAHNIARIHSFDERNYSADECRAAAQILDMLLEYMSRRAHESVTSIPVAQHEIPDAEPIVLMIRP